MEIEEKEIDGIKYVPAKAFYDMWKQLGEEIVVWEACADMLFVWADELKCGTTNQAIYEAVCQDIEKYRKLKVSTNA